MKTQISFIDFVLKEWLLVASGVGLVLTSVYIKRLPEYSANEMQVLFLLFVLFIAANGLLKSGAISKIAQSIEKGKFIPLKLVVITFFLSMLVTNDISLIVIVPITLSLNINRKGILVILEALAANAGSALTPVGNPQNRRCKLFCVNEKAPFGSERTKRVKGAVGAPLRPGAIFAKEL